MYAAMALFAILLAALLVIAVIRFSSPPEGRSIGLERPTPPTAAAPHAGCPRRAEATHA